MALHLDTGVPSVDAEDDFTRARRRYVLDRLGGWLRRDPGQTHLLRFDEVVSTLGFRGEYYLGLRTIRLDTVVGTVEEARGFDRGFRPASDRDRQRWELLDLAERHGAVIPPIEVYRVGGLHFVKDGHHRVSVAIATGQQMIDADVTEVLTQLPAAGQLRTRTGHDGAAAGVALGATHGHRNLGGCPDGLGLAGGSGVRPCGLKYAVEAGRQSSQTAARPASQVSTGMAGPNSSGTMVSWIPGVRKAPVRSTVARANSTVDRLRAQVRPCPFSRAIHSHSATGTKPEMTDSVTKGVFSWPT
jgi:hypothetical protein